MHRTITASAARANLFNLLNGVASATDDIVIVRRRGREEGVALVRETRLRYLEERVRAMDAAGPKQRFSLIGSLQVNGDVDTFLSEIRRDDDATFRSRETTYTRDE